LGIGKNNQYITTNEGSKNSTDLFLETKQLIFNS